ncbi:hypothetical protein DL96DRAFT_650179 [Flagelloscypha sp. PMI_526]|nr:hypothetical protein DL96DRAFT_650179 [Flagelloscypha sp. PMI_526]
MSSKSVPELSSYNTPSTLPLELWIQIFSYSNSFHDAAYLSSTCQLFRVVYLTNQNSIFHGITRTFLGHSFDACLGYLGIRMGLSQPLSFSKQDVQAILQVRELAIEWSEIGMSRYESLYDSHIWSPTERQRCQSAAYNFWRYLLLEKQDILKNTQTAPDFLNKLSLVEYGAVIQLTQWFVAQIESVRYVGFEHMWGYSVACTEPRTAVKIYREAAVPGEVNLISLFLPLAEVEARPPGSDDGLFARWSKLSWLDDDRNGPISDLGNKLMESWAEEHPES